MDFSGFGKKLDVLAKRFPEVALWKKSLVNHMYWTAASTEDGNGDIMEAKWVSLLDHVVDNHINCYHDDLEGDNRKKEWLDKGTDVVFIDIYFSALLIKYLHIK